MPSLWAEVRFHLKFIKGILYIFFVVSKTLIAHNISFFLKYAIDSAHSSQKPPKRMRGKNLPMMRQHSGRTMSFKNINEVRDKSRSLLFPMAFLKADLTKPEASLILTKNRGKAASMLACRPIPLARMQDHGFQ